jgi:alkylation response protein AidB-like acyl-CoA dehydrogenase
MMRTNAQSVLDSVRALAAEFAQQRNERQRRRALDEADFDRLRGAGFLLCAVPVKYGGLWEDAARSPRMVCELLRTLAHGDSSVALVAAMHPAVLAAAGWLVHPDQVPEPFRGPWERQRRWVFQTAVDGAQWGTIMSEPGSGGDLDKTKATAQPTGADGQYRVSGLKHFGSGFGVTSYMITSAVPGGEQDPDTFFADVRGVPWDGSAGLKLVAPWDGHGMAATQSHMMRFEDFPATRVAWPSASRKDRPGVGHPPGAFFCSVIAGIVEVAVETARAQLAPRRAALRPYEQVEWARVEVEAWLIEQAYDGMLRAAEQQTDMARSGRLGKAAIAELSESVLTRICRVIGGGAYSRNSPYGFWLEDVRALGFLRPPWGLAYDDLFASAWPAE